MVYVILFNNATSCSTRFLVNELYTLQYIGCSEGHVAASENLRPTSDRRFERQPSKNENRPIQDDAKKYRQLMRVIMS